MDEPLIPPEMVEARHTPVFDHQSIPDALASSHGGRPNTAEPMTGVHRLTLTED